jgi:hypothetical protein
MIWLPSDLGEHSTRFIETVKAFIKARPEMLDPEVAFAGSSPRRLSILRL